jgi:hypothetical protein
MRLGKFRPHMCGERWREATKAIKTWALFMRGSLIPTLTTSGPRVAHRSWANSVNLVVRVLHWCKRPSSNFSTVFHLNEATSYLTYESWRVRDDWILYGCWNFLHWLGLGAPAARTRYCEVRPAALKTREPTQGGRVPRRYEKSPARPQRPVISRIAVMRLWVTYFEKFL